MARCLRLFYLCTFTIRCSSQIGDESKREIAVQAGCAAVFNRQTEDWVKGVMDLTSGNGLVVVYDGIGSDTVEKSISALSKFGLLSLYGSSSGEVDKLDLSKMRAKSCFLTLPYVFDYKKDRMEFVLTADEIFSKMQKGVFNGQIGHEFSFDNIAKAHDVLESKNSTKSVIITL